jgi:hypothetical protein
MNSSCWEHLVIMICIFYGFCDEFTVLWAFGNHGFYLLWFLRWINSVCDNYLLYEFLWKGLLKPVSEKKPRNYKENKNRVYLPNMWVIWKTMVFKVGEVQAASRRDRRTENNIFTLQGICALRKSKKGKIFLVFFLDLSKAFDKVWRGDIL